VADLLLAFSYTNTFRREADAVVWFLARFAAHNRQTVLREPRDCHDRLAVRAENSVSRFETGKRYEVGLLPI
jgi:hypothetical protein